MTKNYENVNNLKVSKDLLSFVNNELLKDTKIFLNFIENEFDFKTDYPFNKLYLWLEKKACEECIELIVSIMFEPFDRIILPLIKKMNSDEDEYFNIPTNRSVKELKKIIENRYLNILDIDFEKKENRRKFWFISKNKEEPRLGSRFEVNGSELEQPLAIARDIKKLYLISWELVF